MSIAMKSDFAMAKGDTAIRYVIWGDVNAKRRIALVHSLAMSADFWTQTAEQLGPDWGVLAIDCRGHGDSGKPAGPYSVEQFADDLACALDHVGWDTSLVGGASMGGCVAMAFAAAYPDRITGLALLDTTAWYGETAVHDWEERGQKAMQNGMSALTGFQKTRWFSDAFREANPQAVDDAIDIFNANEQAAYLETCRMLGRADMRAALPSFQFPVAIAVGEEDYATPVAMAEKMHAAIPDSSFEILPSARHLTPLEVPEKIARIINGL